jgi:hypothetical protein
VILVQVLVVINIRPKVTVCQREWEREIERASSSVPPECSVWHMQERVERCDLARAAYVVYVVYAEGVVCEYLF